MRVDGASESAAEGRTGGATRVRHLDGIRAIAIAAVLSLHWLSWYSPFLHGGSVGVDVFFVLSGYIITTVLWLRPGSGSTGSRWWGFVRRRVRRLYPALLGLVVGTVVLYVVTPDAPVGPTEVARRGLLALVQGGAAWATQQHGSLWLPDLQPFSPTWSLAVEWYFYLLWPVVVLALRGRGVAARTVALGSLVAALLLYAGSLPLGDFWFYFGPSARAAELLAGATLALWTRADGRAVRPWRHPTALPVLAVLGIGAITLLAPSAHSPLYRLLDVPVTVGGTLVLIQVGYAAPRSAVARLLSLPWLTVIGRCSYSLYLWHLVPLQLLQSGWVPLPRPLIGLLVVACTAALTALSYRFLEQPFLRSRGDVLVGDGARRDAPERRAGRRPTPSSR